MCSRPVGPKEYVSIKEVLIGFSGFQEYVIKTNSLLYLAIKIHLGPEKIMSLDNVGT